MTRREGKVTDLERENALTESDMTTLHIIGEQYPHRLGAVFATERSARSAMENLMLDMNLDEDQVRLVRPGDVAPGRKVEPETRGVRETLWHSHLFCALTGLLVAFGVGGALLVSGLAMVRSAPLLTFAVLGFFGVSAGIITAGVLSLRPDHDRLVNRAVEAANRGEWMLLVHTAERHEADAARGKLEGSAVEIRESL
jgi:hypothetical protein